MKIFQNKDWETIIIDAGKNGLHITEFLISLDLTFEEHEELLESSKKYKRAFIQYEKLCEQYWYNMAHHSMTNSQGQGFNSRLWSLIMRNKFPSRWSESTKVDLTSKGDKIASNTPIQIEIIKPNSNI